MNNQTLKARLLLNAGNLQSSHPQYTYAQNFINDGIRLMVTMASAKFPNLSLFPEYTDTEWTDVTVADQNYLAVPTDMFAPQRVFSSDSSTSPTLANTGWRLLVWLDPQAFDQLPKPTTQLAYPSLWTAREGRIYLHPTPRTTKTTYIKVDGIEDEPDMSGNTDTPRANVRWHPAILDCASHLIWNDLGDYERATQYFDAAEKKVGLVGAAMAGMRRAMVNKSITVAGMPRGY